MKRKALFFCDISFVDLVQFSFAAVNSNALVAQSNLTKLLHFEKPLLQSGNDNKRTLI
jgi:hypothetical protein